MLTGVLLAGVAALWLMPHSSQRENAPVSAAPQLPELYIDRPRWTLFDQQGRPSRQLQARRLEQWAGEEAARLTQPRLNINDRQQRHWLIDAKTGWIYPDERPFLLEQEVTVQQEPANNGLLLQTAQLRIDHNTDTIDTEAPVVLRTGSWHFTSMGMRANLGRQQLELLTQVRGIHE